MFLVALEGSTQGWHTPRFCFRTASLLLIARPMLVRGKITVASKKVALSGLG
jgi:hypothetical protein